ncbi:MAG: hypothetical protein A2Z25_11660 [Planctomycetes bacterium RBG_16_55_9]|nr:MAG: hypothetical protein A2Z25_11660 [Planctomycetes bacterium RBG_16_55_9]
MVVAGITFSFNAIVCAGPPLPTHNVEGNSGVFITSTAYLTNPPEGDAVFGLPSVSFSFAAIGEKDFESIAVTENIWGSVELGYAMERIGLGDWPADVDTATAGTVHVDNHVFVHNFNTRLMVIKEGGFDRPWMPAVTLGAHFKWNKGVSEINRQTAGLCETLGADHDSGVEFTAVVTKTIADWLPRPLIVSAGLRNGDGIHTGLLGFAGERRTTFEGSLIYFLTDKLLLASEYRQKSDLINQCTLGGKDLIKAENDWWDLCLGYIVNDHLTIAGGYADFGSVLNHRENNVWAIQFKYEF